MSRVGGVSVSARLRHGESAFDIRNAIYFASMSSLNLVFKFLVLCLMYVIAKCVPLLQRLCRRKKTVIGTCVIWAPQKQMQAILEGIEYLQNLDSEMFNRLTVERKYVLWYDKKHRTNAYEAYSISDPYLLNGKEGVVIFLVQTVLNRTTQDSMGRFRVKRAEALVAGQANRKQLFEFINKHLFSPRLIKQYQINNEK
jgi:hypothetical protein